MCGFSLCDPNHLDSDSLLYSLPGMSKEQNARFTSTPQSSATYLNLMWTIKSLTLQKPTFEGGEEILGMEWGEVDWLVKIVQEHVSLWKIQYFLVLAGSKIPQKSLLIFPKSLEDLPSQSEFLPELERELYVRGNGLIESYLDTRELSKRIIQTK